MINLNNFKCKNCKRGYKENNSFLSGGICLRCIRLALNLRTIGVYQKTSNNINHNKGVKHPLANSTEKVKGKQVPRNFFEKLLGGAWGHGKIKKNKKAHKST